MEKIDKKVVDDIMAKYNHDFGNLSKNATRKEYKTVLRYVAQESNRRQRQTAGLEN